MTGHGVMAHRKVLCDTSECHELDVADCELVRGGSAGTLQVKREVPSWAVISLRDLR